jgi:hypothetical protein
MEAAEWKPMETSFKAGGASEFIPKGKMVATSEQFPDLDDALGDDKPKKGGKGKKGKGGKKTVVTTKPSAPIEEEVVDETTPWKGKPSTFFNMKTAAESLNDAGNPMNFEMNDNQWKFIFKHYPEFGGAPYEMMVWLFGESKRVEDLNAEAYGKPNNSGTNAQDDDDDESLGESKYDKGFAKK